MNKCSGCGVASSDELCTRCFRIRNYNDYQFISKSNDDFLPILEKVNSSGDLVVLVVDIFNFSDMSLIAKHIKNDVLLVLTKRDILPNCVYDETLLNFDFGINFIDKIIVSSKKNLNFDLLYEKINLYKNSKNVYVVGFTNAGKSTLINKLIYNYSDIDFSITTSPISSTTLGSIEIELDDVTLIDTPGLLLDGDILDTLSNKEIKKVIPFKAINPITYQVKGTQYFYIDKYIKFEVSNINFTMYFSNSLDIKRYYKSKNEYNKVYELEVSDCDVVIRGLGFITFKQSGKIKISTDYEVYIYKRTRLI